MRKNIFIFTLFTIFAWAACESEELLLGENYELELGEQVTFAEGEFTILFDRVVEDSRCPMGVICVWEGLAKVNLKITEFTGSTTDIELITYNSINLDSLQTAEYQDYLIELIQVNPYPHIDSLPITDYSIIINVDEL